MYSEERKPTQRELNKQELSNLWAKLRNDFYSLESKENADILWAQVGNNFVGLGHWYGHYRFNEGYMITIPDDVTELNGKFWPTAQAAYEALVEWANKNHLKIREQETREY